VSQAGSKRHLRAGTGANFGPACSKTVGRFYKTASETNESLHLAVPAWHIQRNLNNSAHLIANMHTEGQINMRWNSKSMLSASVAGLAAICASIPADAAVITFEILQRNSNGNNISNFTARGTGTVKINDSAVAANAFVDITSSAFQAFEINYTPGSKSYNLKLGQDLFRGSGSDPWGLLFDSNGKPYRFENLGTSISTGPTIRELNIPTNAGSNIADLTLVDADGFELVIIDEGFVKGNEYLPGQIVALSFVPAGIGYTSLAGTYGWAQYAFSSGPNPEDTLTGASGYIRFNGFSPDIDIDPSPVPEPASLALLGIGLSGIGAVRRQNAQA
jgi:hypothetical protein